MEKKTEENWETFSTMKFRRNEEGSYTKTAVDPKEKTKRIFLELINRRGLDFTLKRSIKVPINELVVSTYGFNNQWSYNDCIKHLKTLANTSVREFGVGRITHSHLISKMDIIQTIEEPYVELYVGDDVHSNVLEEEFFNTYSPKIQLLQDDLELRLAFELYKQRIQHYSVEPTEGDFCFELYLGEFDLRKSEKEEMLNNIETALAEIKKIDNFLLKDFKILDVTRFSVVCHPLNIHQLKDSAKFKFQPGELQELTRFKL